MGAIRYLCAALSVLVMALVSSSAAIAGIGGIAPKPPKPSGTDLIDKVGSGAISEEQASSYARLAGWTLTLE